MNLKERLADPVFRRIGGIADAAGREVYVVGGYVRDIFLDRTSGDIDFVTVGSGIELAKAVAADLGKGAHLSVFATYGSGEIQGTGA